MRSTRSTPELEYNMCIYAAVAATRHDSMYRATIENQSRDSVHAEENIAVQVVWESFRSKCPQCGKKVGTRKNPTVVVGKGFQ